jgi:hypothetical protein
VRRRLAAVEAAPEVLVRFVADEWADSTQEAFDLWRKARLEYVKAHPGGALGDVLDVLRGTVAARRKVMKSGEWSW